jgi:ABC-2 type transport system ATP-binding protein
MEEKIVIKIQDLKKSFKNVEVLKGLNLSVERGKMLALLGPNGAGKTTTIRILSTLLKPDSGSVSVSGFDVVKDANSVRASIGLTGQYAAVDDYLTGRENLVMMGRLYHLSKKDAKARAIELLVEFDLVEAGDRPAKTYSGGMRRRLDLALSLIATPPILFLDEPTTGLDPRSRITIWEIIKKLMAKGTTILLTTQYLEEADKLADRIAVLDHGVIIAEGTADELKAKVGRERLEFTIEKESNFENALSAINGMNKEVDKDERRISIETDGTVADLKRVLDLMLGAGVEVETFSLHKPTLDDVFLKLTGRNAEEKESIEK